MIHRYPRPLALAFALFGVSAAVAAPNVADFTPFCSKQKQVKDVAIRLIARKTVTISNFQWPMAVFEVQNHGKALLVLEGDREEGNFVIWHPEIIQEFQSNGGSWHEYMYAAGSFMGPTAKIEISAGGTGTFMTEIRPDNSLKDFFPPDTGESRIAYNDYANKRCVYSEIFMMDKPKG